ncbi:MAG: Holliday junction resolvase RuvX [Terriglobales bacterium]
MCSDFVADLNPEQPHRLLGLDVGHRRIGMAVSDPLSITAQGIDTLQRRNKRTDFQQLAKVIRHYHISEIVVGLPLRLSGADSAQTEKVTAFAEELRAKFQLPVHMWDERLTSVQANRLLREAELSIEKRAASVDRMAAILILQSFMDARALSR